MIVYQPTKWMKVIFSWHGTVLPAVLKPTAWFAVFTFALVLWDKYEYPLPQVDPVGHSVLGVVLGLLILFRTNSSNERFWEGRKLWGQLVNSSRNLARAGTAYTGDARDLADLIAGYVYAIKHNLRDERDLPDVQRFLSPEQFQRIASAGNPPALAAGFLSQWIATRVADGRLQPILAAEMERQVATLVDCQGGCERIKKTPIPFVYAVHIKHLIVLYVGTLPFVMVDKLGWTAPVAVAIMAFGLLGVQEAGLEVEDPFNYDPNDLPLDEFCATIARDVAAATQGRTSKT
ncbi:MAG: bestrophin family ion channel [Gemmataceae bacterium]